MKESARSDHELRNALDVILSPEPPPFCILHRPATSRDRLEVIVGDVIKSDRLQDLPLVEVAEDQAVKARPEMLVLVPYRQIRERGFACHDDGEPVIGITVRDHCTVPVDEALHRMGDEPVQLDDGGFDIEDRTYAEIIRRIVRDEIGMGEGSNFVIRRSFKGRIRDYSVRKALAVFRHLLLGEAGAYWTFLVHTGSRTFIGASPERHISLTDGVAVMNPISGTYRYPRSGPRLTDLMRFLADRKETDELYMVVDEELKMMARLCEGGGRIIGPALKEMARLAHTEYFIQGRTSLDVRSILKETMFAPTVTGSPLENACRVIVRHESGGRRFYSGIIARIGRDGLGRQELDSAILIRTADIDRTGELEISVGATLVRHSDPDSEVAETHAKAAGLLAALGVNSHPETRFAPKPVPAGSTGTGLGDHPEVHSALRRRNDRLARFWLTDQSERRSPVPQLLGRRVLVVDAEDTFTEMLAHQLRALGLEVVVTPYDEVTGFAGFDLAVLGPGPGDPSDTADPKIGTLRLIARDLLAGDLPFLAVCLGHQVLASELGLKIVRRAVPNQGTQKEIDLFGRREHVGFYNTFAARHSDDVHFHPAVSGPIAVARDRDSGEVHALRCGRFASVQFHPESLLTTHGVEILRDLITALVDHGSAVGHVRG